MSGETKITVRMIIEVMGKPKEHLVETLEEITKKIGEEKGIKLEEKKIHEPKEIEKQKDLFTTFAEIEIVADGPLQVASIMFKYMPANVEVVSPENLILTNDGYTDVLNELTRRLHGYDELARVFELEKRILENKIKELSEKK